MNNKYPLKKSKTYLSYSSKDIENSKSLLDLLDSVQEHNENSEKSENKNKCKCCNKIILNNKLEIHQVYCFQNKISELESKIEDLKSQINTIRDTTRDLVAHEIRIKGIELLIERNNEKWNKIIDKKYAHNKEYGNKRI